MSLVSYDIANLERSKDFRCLWCLVESVLYRNMVTHHTQRMEHLHIYESQEQRNRGLKYWQRDRALSETVFFLFEIPIDIYLEGAEKQI